MKYIKKFEKVSQFEDFKNSSEWITPNVSYVVEMSKCNFQPYIPPPTMAGDVAYWDGSKVKTISLDNYNTTLGTAIGVVAVPSGFAPDGKTRIISLNPVNAYGNPVQTNTTIIWGPTGDTTLPNYTKVPITDNKGLTADSSSLDGYPVADRFVGTASYADPIAQYFDSPYIPSPYLGDKPNPEYYKQIDGGNALSDFNGLTNTQTLVGLGSSYVAANACWNYNDGASNLQWYLPAIGEIGCYIARCSLIGNSINSLNGYSNMGTGLWSSTEYSSLDVYKTAVMGARIYCSSMSKNYGGTWSAHPFAMLD